jgi:ABC-type transport system substrate-binding protein
MMYSTSSDQAKRINFNDPRIDALLVEGRNLYGTGNDERRKEIYTTIQDYIVEKGFEVPLYIDGGFYTMKTWVKDYKPWLTSDQTTQGIWNAYKEIPTDWQTRDPPH